MPTPITPTSVRRTRGEIAATRYRSRKTIEGCKSRIKAKLGMKSQAALAQLAWRVKNGVG